MLRGGASPAVGARLQLLHAVGGRKLVPNHFHGLPQSLRRSLRALVPGALGPRRVRRVPAVVLADVAPIREHVVALRVRGLVPQSSQDHTAPHEPQKAPIRPGPRLQEVRVRNQPILPLLRQRRAKLLSRSGVELASPDAFFDELLQIDRFVRAGVIRLSHARAKERIPALVLLVHPVRHPAHEHGIHQHLHERHGPTELPTLAVHGLRVELGDQILHAQVRSWPFLKPGGAPEDRPHGVAQVKPWRVEDCALRQPGIPCLRRHHPPMSNHRRTGVVAVAVAQNRRAVRREARCHHEHALVGRIDPHKFTADFPELPPELVQRSVRHVRLGQLAGLRLLLLDEFPPVVELVDLAVPRHGRVVGAFLDLPHRTEHARASGVQGHAVQQREDERQAQANVHGFEDAVVPVAERLREDVLPGFPEQVHALALGLVLADLVHGGAEDLAQALAAFRRLGGVLRDVLTDGPEVHARTPVDVPEVVHQDVRLVVAAQAVVPRKAREPRAQLLALVQAHRPIAPTADRVQRETVTADGALRLPTRARMFPENRFVHLVQLVPPTGLHQGSDEAPHRRQVGRLTRGRLEDRVEQGSQARPLRTRGVHGPRYLHVVRADVLVPEEPPAATVVVARIPLGNEVAEEVRESALHAALVLQADAMVLPAVG